VLSGSVPESEADDLIDAAYSIRGVRGVESRVETHKTSENVPGLARRLTTRQSASGTAAGKLVPWTRLLIGAGGAIALYRAGQ
jgi:hypothetical protein